MACRHLLDHLLVIRVHGHVIVVALVHGHPLRPHALLSRLSLIEKQHAAELAAAVEVVGARLDPRIVCIARVVDVAWSSAVTAHVRCELCMQMQM